MKKYLLEKVMPFWMEDAIDFENGGIFTQLTRDGKIYGREKSGWFQGRALYIFSLIYNDVEKDEKYLRIAKNIFDFFPKITEKNGRLPFTVTEDGRPIQKRRYYFSETFAAIGCCEYYLASGDIKAKDMAENYFDVAYSIYTGKKQTQPKFENYPYIGLSPSMIMLATAQVMRKIDKKKYDIIAKGAVKDILSHLTEHGLLENIGENGEFIDTPTGRLINPGHSLEAAWFLMAEGVYQKDNSLIEVGKKIIDISMKLGLLGGGIISFCDCKGFPPTALEWDMKLWWPQCEAIIANRLCYKLSGEKKYLNWYEEVKEYAFSHFEDKEYGEWYGYLHYDASVSNTLKGNIFKGPFHLPRMLIILDKIEKGEAII
ncbi:MAG: AGE family epimerase/isomerase [Clostridia bacterium]|nr:AGE family epimerase/isomerase [Clostridia bacterium]